MRNELRGDFPFRRTRTGRRVTRGSAHREQPDRRIVNARIGIVNTGIGMVNRKLAAVANANDNATGVRIRESDHARQTSGPVRLRSDRASLLVEGGGNIKDSSAAQG